MLKSFFEEYAEKSMDEIEVDLDLKNRLARKMFQKKARTPILFTLFNTMKRYSFTGLVTLTIFVFTLTSIIQTPLKPQEVLAKAMENYETGEGEIYHEEILTESYENDQKIYSYLSETYRSHDGKKELYIEKNPATKEITSVFLNLTDQFGDIQSGFKDYQTKEVSAADNLTYEEYEEEMKVNGMYDWFNTFKGEKIYCVDVIRSQEGEGKSFLILAKDDYSVYQVTGESGMEPDFDAIDIERSQLMDLQKNPVSSKDYVEKLIQQKAYDYSQVEEGGNKYNLFKLIDNDEMVWFYFSPENNRLVYYDTYLAKFNEPSGFQKVDRTTILQNESFPQENFPTVFNPDRFEGLELFPALSATPLKLEESGCYDYQRQPLNTDSILKDVPEKAMNEWKESTQYIKFDLGLAPRPQGQESGNATMSELLDEPNPGLHLSEVHFPVAQANPMTQGYHAGHFAWDFAIKGEGDRAVYSSLDGKVLKAAKEGWNGGYGNTLLLQHQIDGKNLEIRYAHLNEIYVAVGDEIKAGQKIATMGKTGRLFGEGKSDVLHFEVVLDGKKINPKWLFE